MIFRGIIFFTRKGYDYFRTMDVDSEPRMDTRRINAINTGMIFFTRKGYDYFRTMDVVPRINTRRINAINTGMIFFTRKGYDYFRTMDIEPRINTRRINAMIATYKGKFRKKCIFICTYQIFLVILQRI